ncbi:MAG: hypothetical protein JXA08_05065 [Methanomicrobiaceae archaeon]|nr:hypothetical protein [Methanomicrobiaceae archaeon]
MTPSKPTISHFVGPEMPVGPRSACQIKQFENTSPVGPAVDSGDIRRRLLEATLQQERTKHALLKTQIAGIEADRVLSARQQQSDETAKIARQKAFERKYGIHFME